MRTFTRLSCAGALLAFALGCNPQGGGPPAGPVAEGFRGHVVHNGERVTFNTDSAPQLLLDGTLGIPLKADGSFELKYLEEGTYTVSYHSLTSGGFHPLSGADLTVTAGQSEYIIELGPGFSANSK